MGLGTSRRGTAERASGRERAAAFRALFEDERGFRSWYDEALPRVFGYLLDRCGRRSIAEELTQETFVEAVRHRGRFDGRADPVTWVVGIARHKLVDHFRRLSREERRHLSLVARSHAEPAEADLLELAAIREDTLGALRSLPAMQRAALVFHYLDELPVAEVAIELNRTEHAVESLLARGRARLRQALADTDAAAPTDGDEGDIDA